MDNKQEAKMDRIREFKNTIFINVCSLPLRIWKKLRPVHFRPSQPNTSTVATAAADKKSVHARVQALICGHWQIDIHHYMGFYLISELKMRNCAITFDEMCFLVGADTQPESEHLEDALLTVLAFGVLNSYIMELREETFMLTPLMYSFLVKHPVTPFNIALVKNYFGCLINAAQVDSFRMLTSYSDSESNESTDSDPDLNSDYESLAQAITCKKPNNSNSDIELFNREFDIESDLEVEIGSEPDDRAEVVASLFPNDAQAERDLVTNKNMDQRQDLSTFGYNHATGTWVNAPRRWSKEMEENVEPMDVTMSDNVVEYVTGESNQVNPFPEVDNFFCMQQNSEFNAIIKRRSLEEWLESASELNIIDFDDMYVDEMHSKDQGNLTLFANNSERDEDKEKVAPVLSCRANCIIHQAQNNTDETKDHADEPWCIDGVTDDQGNGHECNDSDNFNVKGSACSKNFLAGRADCVNLQQQQQQQHDEVHDLNDVSDTSSLETNKERRSQDLALTTEHCSQQRFAYKLQEKANNIDSICVANLNSIPNAEYAEHRQAINTNCQNADLTLTINKNFHHEENAEESL